MKNPVSIFFKKIDWLLAAILLLAFVLRFWRFRTIPFMHDEFSALFRLDYGSFSELIIKGVIPDAHPAGAHLLIAAINHFVGWHPVWIKLPFALMGVATVWLVFLNMRFYFSQSSAYLAATIVAVMQFFIFYSQIARPYSSGLFFVMAALWFGSRLTKDAVKDQKYIFAGYVLCLVLASMMHYFSMMMAGFVFLGLLFLAKPGQIIVMMKAGILAAVLYLPNLPIAIRQLTAGGIGDWLGQPSADFVVGFFGYTFHFSWLFGSVVMLIFLAAMLLQRVDTIQLRASLLFVFWFLLALAIGWVYSRFRTPVLQYSTLFFSFPFFIMGLAGFVKQLKPINTTALVVLVAIPGTMTLVFSRQHYKMMYEQGYDQLAVHYSLNKERLGADVMQAAVSGSTRMTGFYQEKRHLTETRLYTKYASASELAGLVDTCTRPYFSMGWTDYAPYHWIELVRSRYPKVIASKNWFNSGYYLLQKDSLDSRQPMADERFIYQESAANGLKTFTPADTYGLLWEGRCDSLLEKGDGILVAGSEVVAHEAMSQVSLVMEIRIPEVKEPIIWRSGTLEGNTIEGYKKSVLVVVHHLDAGPSIPPGSTLRVYYWNKGKESFQVRSRWLYIKKQDPVLFGLYAPL